MPPLQSKDIAARLRAAAAKPLAEKEPHEVELEKKMELLRKVRMQRDNSLLNRGAVENKKPDKAYVWVNISESRRVIFEGYGYVVCKDPDIKTRWKREDGTHRRGDLILYEVPRELHEAIQLDNELRAVEDLETSKDLFKEFASRNNVPVSVEA